MVFVMGESSKHSASTGNKSVALCARKSVRSGDLITSYKPISFSFILVANTIN